MVGLERARACCRRHHDQFNRCRWSAAGWMTRVANRCAISLQESSIRPGGAGCRARCQVGRPHRRQPSAPLPRGSAGDQRSTLWHIQLPSISACPCRLASARCTATWAVSTVPAVPCTGAAPPPWPCPSSGRWSRRSPAPRSDRPDARSHSRARRRGPRRHPGRPVQGVAVAVRQSRPDRPHREPGWSTSRWAARC
jgi:hypothetical protein